MKGSGYFVVGAVGCAFVAAILQSLPMMLFAAVLSGIGAGMAVTRSRRRR